MRVFSDPTIHTCIIILARGEWPKQIVKIRKRVSKTLQLKDDYDYELPQDHLGKNQNFTFDIFIDPIVNSLLVKLSSNAKPLGDRFFIRQCIKTGNDNEFVRSSSKTLSSPWKPTLRGRSIGRYETIEKNLFLKYGPWLARNWKNTSFYETQKIAIRETGSQIVSTIDLENRYFLSSLYAVYPKSSNEPLSLSYILGILNSALATFFVKIVAFDLTHGAFTKIRTNQLARLPIRIINFADQTDAALHNQMVNLVEKMLVLHKRIFSARTPPERELYQRQIEATDKQIDQLVYQLYGLSLKEIKVVERENQLLNI
jgi:hypothetical protein